MSIIRDYLSITPCRFFEESTVKKCLIRFMQKYSGGGSGGLTVVSTINSGTIAFSGTGTVLDPLAADFIGTAPSLQDVAAVGSTSTIGLSANSLLVSNNYDVPNLIFNRPVNDFTAASIRFAFVMENTESGANSGSNLRLSWYNDAGTIANVVFKITRSTGVLDFQNNPRFQGQNLFAGATVINQYVVGANTALANTDTVNAALGKIQGQINSRATLASPTFTGTPSAPTAAPGTNTTQVATTAFVTTEVTNKVLSATATLDFPDTAAGESADLTITVTGALVGDPVVLAIPPGSMTANGAYLAWVSATNTVNVRFFNYALVASNNPSSGLFKVSVLKY